MQKNERTERQRELEEMAAEPFARTIDDPKLEAMRREVIRDEDPMAEYMRHKKNKEVRGVQTQSGAKPSKPRYQGPVAPPNRFGIPPGYRWDAINRGNDFEHRVLLQKGQKSSLREDEHRWSTADM